MKPNPPPRPLAVKNTRLLVKDLKESKPFYCDILGLLPGKARDNSQRLLWGQSNMYLDLVQVSKDSAILPQRLVFHYSITLSSFYHHLEQHPTYSQARCTRKNFETADSILGIRPSIEIVDPDNHELLLTFPRDRATTSKTPENIETVRIHTLDELIIRCNGDDTARGEKDNGHPRHLYRGQRNPFWGLQSSFERIASARIEDEVRFSPNPKKVSPNTSQDLKVLFTHEQEALSSFQEYLSGEYKKPVSRDEANAYARHHDFKYTRLLDWSESPEVAVFFAISGWISANVPEFATAQPTTIDSNDGVVVWRLKSDSELQELPELEVSQYKSATPTISARQQAQSGWFTRMKSCNIFCLCEFLHKHNLETHLTKFTIPATLCQQMFLQLHKKGVSYISLFPDAWGAAQNANYQYVLNRARIQPPVNPFDNENGPNTMFQFYPDSFY